MAPVDSLTMAEAAEIVYPILSPIEEMARAATLRGRSIADSISILIMGMIIDSVLLGVMLSQLIHWFQYQRQAESKRTQYMVLWCAFMGGVMFTLLTCWIMYLFGFHFGSWVPFTDYRWFSFFPFVDVLMVIPVQCFYAERAFKISNRVKALVPVIAVPMVVTVGSSVGIIVCGLTNNHEVDIKYSVFVWLWICGTAFVDIVITLVVLWGLTKSRSPWEQTDMLVKRLIRVACESQLPPTICAVALLLDWIVQRDSFTGVFFEMIQGKLYVVGMIYVLNQRFYLRRELEGDSLTKNRAPNAFSNFRSSRKNSNPLGPATIHVQTETYVEAHQINPAFMPQRLQPKIREASESGETETEMSELGVDGVNQSEIGLNSDYMERVRATRKKPEFNVASFAAMG